MKTPGVNHHSLNPSDPGATRYIVTSQHGSSVPASQSNFQMLHQTLGMQPSPYLTAGHSVRDLVQQQHLMGARNMPLLASHPLGLLQFQQQQQQHIVDQMPPRRAPGAMRVSLLRDIGKAGERDRAETSMPSSHGYMSFSSGHVSDERSAMGLSNIPSHSLLADATRQTGSLTPPHHLQMHRQSINQSPHLQGTIPSHYSVQQSAFMPPNDKRKQQQIKTEPGLTYVKDDGQQSSNITQMHLSQNAPLNISSYPQNVAPKMEVEKKSNINHHKEELVQTMEKFDRDILKINNEVERLERKKQQLEEAAKKPREPEKESIQPKQAISKHQELWQVIYAENKKKAESAKDVLKGLGRWYEMPLYNQPCDTKVYQDNIKKNEEMRPKLLAYFKRRATLHNIRDNYLSSRYDELMDDWQKRISKIENNPKRKAKDAKVRDFFEKQFPEIKKQREQQDRFQRGNRGDSCRSDADFAEIVDGLTEQENHEQNMRQLAVVPPILLDKEERRVRFVNNNGLIKDAFKDYKEQQQLDNWSDSEKGVFKEKYILHPKNFNLIASCLEKKSVPDCVLFYYLTKKKVNYKGLSRKNTLKPRKPKSGRGQTASNNDSKDGKDDKKDCDGTMKDDTDDRIDRPPSPRVTRSRNKNLNWTDEDIVIAKEGFSKHGKDYAAISRLFQNKSEQQVKNFYNNYKKKHNLDQLINNSQEGKRRKEGRRGRNTNISESATEPETAVTEDESSKDSNDTAVCTKKQRKENTESPLTIQEDVVMSTEKAESTSAESSAINTSSTIRTRSAAATDVKPTESGKRPPESQTNEAPAEKRIKKSRVITPTKKDEKNESKKESGGKPKAAKALVDSKDEPTISGSEALASHSDNNQVISTTAEVKKTSAAITETLDTSTSNKADNSLFDEKEQNRSTTFKEPPKVLPAATETPSASKQTSTGTDTLVEDKMHKEAPTTNTTTTQGTTPPVTMEATSTIAPASTAPAVPSKPVSTSISQTTESMEIAPVIIEMRKDEYDSSATCSADEESANFSDFSDSNKLLQKQHSESPYAFDDNTTSQIRLETKPKPIAKSVEPDIVRPATVTGDINKTTGNLRTIALTWVPPTENVRPQSVPSAVAMQRPTIPLPTVSQNKLMPTQSQGGRPSSTPMFAVQDMRFPGSRNITRPVVISKSTKPSQAIANSLSATQVVDAIRKNEMDNRSMPATFPHYHQVPQSAMSLQKDFLPNVGMKLKESPMMTASASGPRTYTSADKAAMHERAAVIPVGKLKYSDPPSSDAFRRPESTISVPSAMQPHLIPQTFSMAGLPHVLQTEARGVSIMQGKPVTTLATITTSAIPTKFVTTTLPTTSRQATDTPMNLSRTSTTIKPQASMAHDVYSQRPRSGSDVGKYSVAGHGSIVQGTPIKQSQSSAEMAQRGQKLREYKSKNIIQGREIIVQAPKPSAITSSGDNAEDKAKIPPPQMHINPFQQTVSVASKQEKPKHPASILQGTPIPRKLSDESSSMSPIRNPSPFAGRHSPAQGIKVESRHVNPSSTQLEMVRQAMASHQFAQQQGLWGEGGRQSADLHREQAIRQQQEHRIKQEVSSPSIHVSQPRLAASSMNPRHQNPTQIPLDFLRMPAFAAAANVLTGNKNQMDMNILMRQYQYGGITGMAVQPLSAALQQGLSYCMPMHSSTSDNSLSTVLSQDYQTARLMDKTLPVSGNTTPSQAGMSRLPYLSHDYRLMSQNIPRLYQGMINPSQPQQPLHSTSPCRASQSPNAYMGGSSDVLMARNRSNEDLSKWKNQMGRSPGRASSSPRIDNSQEKYLQQQRHIGQARQQHSPTTARSLEQPPHREYTPEQHKLMERQHMFLLNQQHAQHRAEAAKKESQRSTPEFHHYRSGSYDRSRMYEQQRTCSPNFMTDRSSPKVIADKQQIEVKQESKTSESYTMPSTASKDRNMSSQPPTQQTQRKPQSKMTSEEILKSQSHNYQMISQQMEELKSKGQTKMTAESLMSAIIIHQMDRPNKNGDETPTSSKDKQKQVERSANSSPCPAVTLPMPAIHPMMIMNMGRLVAPSMQPTAENPKNQSVTEKQKLLMMEPQMRNLEQKSRKIINEMYSSPSQLSRPGSANSSKDKSPTYKTEPISPPSHKKTTAQLEQQALLMAQSGSMISVGAGHPPPIPQHINPTNINRAAKSLEEIIRDALAQDSDAKSRSAPVSVISSAPHTPTDVSKETSASIAQQQQNYMMSALFVKQDVTASPSQAPPPQPAPLPGMHFQHAAPSLPQQKPPAPYHQPQETVPKPQPPPQTRQPTPRPYQPPYQQPKQQVYEEISDEED